MSTIGLVAVLVILGQIILVIGTGSLVLWVQRKFFLLHDEPQSFFLPGVVALFTSLYYFWLVIQIDVP